MPAALRKSEHRPSSPSVKKSTVRAATEYDSPALSPALEAQARLSSLWAAAESQTETPARWSKRKTVLFLLTTCGGFWLAVGLAISRLLR
jgi:hypothetical protein